LERTSFQVSLYPCIYHVSGRATTRSRRVKTVQKAGLDGTGKSDIFQNI
jgi:hypothetical protein